MLPEDIEERAESRDRSPYGFIAIWCGRSSIGIGGGSDGFDRRN